MENPTTYSNVVVRMDDLHIFMNFVNAMGNEVPVELSRSVRLDLLYTPLRHAQMIRNPEY